MTEDAEGRLALLIARGFHAVAAPIFAELAGQDFPDTEEGLDALWEDMDIERKQVFIDMAASFTVFLQGEGLAPAGWEWAVEHKGPNLEGDYDRLVTKDGHGRPWTADGALEEFRSLEFMFPGTDFVRLVRRGVTDWKQVIDDGA